MSAAIDKVRDAFAAVGAAEAAAQRQRAVVSNLKSRHQQAIATRDRLREAKDREAALRLLSDADEESSHG